MEVGSREQTGPPLGVNKHKIMERSALRKISREAHEQLRDDMRGETRNLQNRILEKLGHEYSLFYIRMVLNPEKKAYNEEIIDEAIALQGELRLEQKRLDELILQQKEYGKAS